uniref:Uncharacterized protein n=1 Tax=Arundo donax TaxID=35708 RepID=A0A0A9BFH0_ARUDO
MPTFFPMSEGGTGIELSGNTIMVHTNVISPPVT